MMKTAPRPGLAVLSIDPAGDLPRLRSWYREERLPAMLAVPGVAGVTEWEAVTRYGVLPEGGHGVHPAPPAYIVMYELDDTAVALSEAFLDATGRDYRLVATVDGQRIEYQQEMRITLDFVMERANPEAATTTARGMLVVSITPERDFVPVLHEWYDTVHIRELMSCPGFLRTRRYESVDGLKSFFAFYELDSPAALQTEQFTAFSERSVAELPEIHRRLRPHRTTNICDVYRLLE